jgi:hypothetical protein
MYRISILLLLVIVSTSSLSQTFEIGPSLQYHRTAFQRPDGSIVINTGPTPGVSEGKVTTETDSNIAFGGYAAYYTENTFAYIGELFYVSTSSPNYGDNSFQSINLIPSVAVEIFNSNLFVNVGVGAGFILNEPDFEGIDEIPGNEYKSTDLLLKLALNFRLKKLLTIDGGLMQGLTKVVDESNRVHFYLGVRIPLNLFLNK